jgi:hypothetical protein
MVRLHAIAEIATRLDYAHQLNYNDDVLGALEFTFDQSKLNHTFPSKVKEWNPPEGSTDPPQYQFRLDYTQHLEVTMSLAMCFLNKFLYTAGNERCFSFGLSTFYGNRPFQQLIYEFYPTKQVALHLNSRILHRLDRAHKGILLFMECSTFDPAKGYPQVVSPAFTSSNDFGKDVVSLLMKAGVRLQAGTPERKDRQWDNNVMADIVSAYSETGDSPRERNSDQAASPGPQPLTPQNRPPSRSECQGDPP